MKLIGLTLAVACAAAFAGEPGIGEAAGKTLAIQASISTDKKDIAAVLGRELEPGVAVVELTVTPTGDPVKLWWGDFVLRSDKDGQRSDPYDPVQLAGSSVLVVGTTYEGGPILGQDNGQVWGDPRSPRRLPGPRGATGSTLSGEYATARLDTDPEPNNELLALLQKRVLKEEEISEPVTGLLYFLLEGKHKTKQLWLHYRGNGEKIDIRFQRRKK